jgi:Ca-activated chloride channel family protein
MPYGRAEPAEESPLDVRAVAAAEARRLRDAAGRPEYERRELLEDLGTRLAAIAGSAPETQPLRDLALALRAEEAARRPLEELWAHALRVLDELAGGHDAPRGRAFWKR